MSREKKAYKLSRAVRSLMIIRTLKKLNEMKYCPYLVGLIRGSAKTVCSRVQARAKIERKRMVVSKIFEIGSSMGNI